MKNMIEQLFIKSYFTFKSVGGQLSTCKHLKVKQNKKIQDNYGVSQIPGGLGPPYANPKFRIWKQTEPCVPIICTCKKASK